MKCDICGSTATDHNEITCSFNRQAYPHNSTTNKTIKYHTGNTNYIAHSIDEFINYLGSIKTPTIILLDDKYYRIELLDFKL